MTRNRMKRVPWRDSIASSTGARLREQMRTHPQDQQDRDALRQWQADRLGRTHRDLLESKRYGAYRAVLPD